MAELRTRIVDERTILKYRRCVLRAKIKPYYSSVHPYPTLPLQLKELPSIQLLLGLV